VAPSQTRWTCGLLVRQPPGKLLGDAFRAHHRFHESHAGISGHQACLGDHQAHAVGLAGTADHHVASYKEGMVAHLRGCVDHEGNAVVLAECRGVRTAGRVVVGAARPEVESVLCAGYRARRQAGVV
jgi:hypothetical protein